MSGAPGAFVEVDGARTHYLEAGARHKGRRPSVLLLHSAEFGGAAELSWEHNLAALGERWHVLAPDHLGFGRSAKLFDFNGQFNKRVQHVKRFLETMGVAHVHAVGSSMSGGLCLTVAARLQPDWPIASVICCSGGGDAPDNEARRTLNSYEGGREHMRRIVATMFVDPKWAADEVYVERRWLMSREPGAWEATAAARFKAPFAANAASRERDAIDYGAIRVPTLIFAGRHDTLRAPGYTAGFAPKIPDASVHIFERAGHMGNIECADEFNATTIAFLNAVEAR